MIKCLGCGAPLQNSDASKIGYTLDMSKKLCKRCFEIRSYNAYSKVSDDKNHYINILNNINKTKDLVLLVIDLFSIHTLKEINIDNPVILVFTKRDLLPRGTDEQRLLAKINGNLNIVGKVMISSKNNYQMDELYHLIMKHKISNNVYVIGYTSTGKSTLINKFIYNYGNRETEITTSPLPSTTLDLIETKINDELTLIDTPGLLDDGSIILTASKEELKKIIPKKEIRPIVIQVKCPQTIIVDNLFRIDAFKGGSLVFYMANNLKINRFYNEKKDLKNLKKYHFDNLNNEDIIIKGLGFIKAKNITNIDVYISENIKILTEQSLM